MDKDHISGLIILPIKVPGNLINSLDKANTYGVMAVSIRVNGKKI